MIVITFFGGDGQKQLQYYTVHTQFFDETLKLTDTTFLINFKSVSYNNGTYKSVAI